MATPLLRDKSHTAVLIMDYQNDIVSGMAANHPQLLDRAAAVLSGARLAIAVEHCPPDISNITWLAVTAEALSTSSAVAFNTFQVIYANYVLRRVQDPRVVLHNIAHYLCPGGRFVMQTVVDMPPLVRELTILTGPRGENS